jgi:hypothetical protein
MPQEEGPPVLGDSCPRDPPVVAVSALQAILAQIPQFNHLSRPSHLHALEQTLDQINSIMPQRTSSAGVTPCPRDPSSGGSGLCEPILAKSPKFNHLGRQSHLHALEQNVADQINSIMPQRRTSSTGRLPHLPQDPSRVAVVSGPFWPSPPQVQSFESSKAISMHWGCRSNQLNHAWDLQYWRLPAPGTHPSGGGVCEHFGQNPQVQSFESSRVHAMEQALQIKSTIMPQEGPQYWVTPTCPRDPSSGGSGLCQPFWPKIPIPIHLVVRSHLHALEQTLQINQLESCHKKDLQYHCPRDCQWWHWSRSEPILAKILTSSIIWVVRARNTPCVGT